MRKGLKIKSNVKEGLPVFAADEDKILQVLINLLSNAIKFTPEGKEICVAAALFEGKRASDEGGYIHFSVTDNGVGILREDLPRIFDRFRQCGDMNGNKHEGTGLGLSICKEIVQAHHGDIWAESVPEQGSTFHVILPIESTMLYSCPATDDNNKPLVV